MNVSQGRMLLLAGALVLVVMLVSRWAQGRVWARGLTAWRLRLPRGLDAGQVGAAVGLLGPVAARRPVVLEVWADRHGISHWLVAHRRDRGGVMAALRAALPGLRMDEDPAYPRRSARWRAGAEVGLTNRGWPLAADRATLAVSGLLAGLYPLSGETVARTQWVLWGARARRPAGADVLGTEDRRAVRDKNAAPVFRAVGRVSVAGGRGEAMRVLAWVLAAWRAQDAAGVRVRRTLMPSRAVVSRARRRALPLLRWPALANTDELAGLVGLPVGLYLPGVSLGSCRQLPPGEVPAAGLLLARSNYPGMVGRRLCLTVGDRLRHVAIQAPTGAGKSTLVANMALQDIDAGRGVVVIDPKTDLVADILERIPPDRADDVIVMDPRDTTMPVGFNILRAGSGPDGRELVADHVTGVFADLWAASWGPRTADVLRCAVLTLASTRPAAGGARFTLVEVPELLTNPALRTFVLRQKSVPEAVRSFWDSYERMSDAERASTTGPAMNKLRALLSRTSLRLMLGQPDGIDIGQVLYRRKILLVPLAKGQVGAETARLLGSLVMAGLWHEALGRSALPAARRRPVFAYLDEFQDFVRFGGAGQLADMLAQARGLGLGLTLAHQYLDQLPAGLLAAVAGTVRTHVTFQLEYDDAHEIARRYDPFLTESDLMGLGTYEIAARCCVNGATVPPVTGTTPPPRPPAPVSLTSGAGGSPGPGRPRAAVEKAITERARPPANVVPLGRARGGPTVP